MAAASDPQLLFNQAQEFQQQGRLPDALARYEQVLAHQPEFFEALYNRAILLSHIGRDEEALASLDKALALRPGSAEGWNNRGNILRSLKRQDQALESFRHALTLKPQYPGVFYNLGNLLLLDFRQASDALAAYDQALALKPDFAEAWNNRGNALCSLGQLEQAITSYDRALAIRPDFAEALNCRGQALFESDRIDDGIASFMRAAELGLAENPAGAPPYKLRHDREQQDYRMATASPAKAGARLAGPAVAPADSHAGEDWQTKKPQIVVIDNLLTPQALEELRRFCLEAPVWHASYENGYLGAFPGTGFACPLLGQIAEELRRTFPAIFGGHPLLYMWGFKYDSRLTGINIHADESAVNVNFWITPDEANLDPQSGGLVIWDVAAPLDWDFARFNGNPQAIRDFLSKAGAKSVRVPYRANRAVIFDSDLFHETDTIRFKDGYLNRRINITMLYGRRDSH